MNRHDAWYGHFDLLQNQRRVFSDPNLDRFKSIAAGFSFLFWIWLLIFPIKCLLFGVKLKYGKEIDELIHSVPDFEVFLVLLFLGSTLLTAILKTWGNWQISRSPSKMSGHENGVWMFGSWLIGILLETIAVTVILMFSAMYPGRAMDGVLLLKIMQCVAGLGSLLQYIAGIFFFIYAFALADLLPRSRCVPALMNSMYSLAAVFLSYECLPFIASFFPGLGRFESLSGIWAVFSSGFYLWLYISLLCVYRFLAVDLRKYVKAEEMRAIEE